METTYSLIVVCSAVLFQLCSSCSSCSGSEPSLFSRLEISEKREWVNNDLSTNDVEAGSLYPRGLAPGYKSQECNIHKRCPRGKYCHVFICLSCKCANQFCTDDGQCCGGLRCTFGKCKGRVAKGALGTFCRAKSDCSGSEVCCVREPAINPVKSICKAKLGRHKVCGPYNQFRTVWLDACGPCKTGLACKKVGIFGVNEVCL